MPATHIITAAVPAGDVIRDPPSVQGPLPRAVSNVGTASAAGPGVGEVTNLGLEHSVLGERALQPCDRVLHRNNISWLSQRGVKNSSWCLHCSVPSGLLTLPQDFAQSSHLLSLLISPEPWLQEWPTPFKQVCAHTHLPLRFSSDSGNSFCFHLFCASLLCSPKLGSPATWSHYTQTLGHTLVSLPRCTHRGANHLCFQSSKWSFTQ